ncbi:MAG: saccharopine dehydrogenase NADP-binding domain-containing protein [Paenibacillus dendritiformis]|uniref:saccharopine dehydrogenase family protein n=1 Tax=uncultured Paenibacillus sp. TaxID=227322 RepID=UPI0025DA717C|nr:saccharopine dehydrogenase NADP-binding domain-containing protein [uncultured Paenibacillus sp.]MDU5145857.1 saccharopine dehydrogenase NADP-binding domain-containing protein [Paenibacillus dendritiformis]
MEMHAKEEIVVIGGYGHVGRNICRILGERYPGMVFAAGRSRERAERFCQSAGGKIRPLEIDIRNPRPPAMFDGVKLVIMCLDQADTGFVRECLRAGTHYIDISANGSFLRQVEQCREEAEAYGATALLSVGLAPGLTNLLALEAHRMLGETDEIDLAIMLGLGDAHGEAAIEWMADNLGARFDITRNGKQVEAQSFADGKTFDFGADIGSRQAYRFPFSDQQSLSRTLNVASVATRFCLDSPIVTRLLAGARRTWAVRLLQRGWLRKRLIRSLGALRFGGDRFAVKAEARGRSREGKPALAECFLQGRDQSAATARVAAAAAAMLVDSPSPAGVYHIDQLTDMASMLKEPGPDIEYDLRLSELAPEGREAC